MKDVLRLVKANPRKVHAFVCLAAFLTGFLTAFTAQAEDAQPRRITQVPDQSLSLMVHSGRLIKLSGAAANVFVADPAIADVQVPSATSIYVLGKKAGHTNIYALNQSGDAIYSANVTVSYDVGAIKTLFREEFPDASLTVRSTTSGVMLGGELRSEEEVKRAVDLAQSSLSTDDKVLNQISVRAPNQVNLRVRVAEMNREVAKQLGFNWQAIFGQGNWSFSTMTNHAGSIASPDQLALNFAAGGLDLTAMIDALAKQGIVTTLAEPNLTAISGETASFLAGGEFPIPVGVNSGDSGTRITIEYKQFGIGLNFTPTVLSPERISLKVRPEVSQISDSFSIETNNIKIPGIQVRRAETTVELASGQSFAIAGLMDNRTTNAMSNLPGAASIPILGPLFQSSEFRRNESELIIIVTPYIVTPIKIAQNQIPTPVDQWQPSSDLERSFGQHLGVPQKAEGSHGAVGQGGQGLIGDAGFYY